MLNTLKENTNIATRAVTFVDQLHNVESSGISFKNTSFTSHKAAFDYSVINGYNHLCIQRNASQ